MHRHQPGRPRPASVARNGAILSLGHARAARLEMANRGVERALRLRYRGGGVAPAPREQRLTKREQRRIELPGWDMLTERREAPKDEILDAQLLLRP
jgi:hypothetical protein